MYKVPSLNVEIRFIVYLLDQDEKIVFTDVDGTITVSDVVGKVH
jgi:phosphatidate phosphatase PAH1